MSVIVEGFNTSLLVVLYYGSCHVVVTSQSLFEGFCIVVAALNEGVARNIILHWDFGRMVGKMVSTTGGRMD
jgi:hypothetical protein